jgi:hypothetical protein
MCKGVEVCLQPIPTLPSMSASFCLEEQAKFSPIWGPMARRGIIFDVSVLGVVSGSLSNQIVLYLKHNPTYKLILYTNTKLLAEGHILALI